MSTDDQIDLYPSSRNLVWIKSESVMLKRLELGLPSELVAGIVDKAQGVNKEQSTATCLQTILL